MSEKAYMRSCPNCGADYPNADNYVHTCSTSGFVAPPLTGVGKTAAVDMVETIARLERENADLRQQLALWQEADTILKGIRESLAEIAAGGEGKPWREVAAELGIRTLEDAEADLVAANQRNCRCGDCEVNIGLNGGPCNLGCVPCQSALKLGADLAAAREQLEDALADGRSLERRRRSSWADAEKAWAAGRVLAEAVQDWRVAYDRAKRGEVMASPRWHRQEYVSGWLVGQEQPTDVGPWFFQQEDDARRLEEYLNSRGEQVRVLTKAGSDLLSNYDNGAPLGYYLRRFRAALAVVARRNNAEGNS